MAQGYRRRSPQFKRYVLQHHYEQIAKKVPNEGQYQCYFCKYHFKFNDLTLEHLLPVSRGGAKSDHRNHEVACQPCNNLKGDLTVDEFLIKYDLPSYYFPRRGFREEDL